MAHSIPDSCAVVLRTELGPILITGDYKFDQTPVDGNPADVSRLAELGAEGVLCLCGDSTNADRPGHRAVGVERRPRPAGPVRALPGSDHRHLVRLQRPSGPAGDRRRRRSSTAGWPSWAARCARTSTSPRTSGSPTLRTGMLIPPREIESFPDHKVVAISTGSQGEPLSALRRMAHADHPDVELHSGDTVIFSATPVPGNERSVNETIDRIFEIGAEVVTAADAPNPRLWPRLAGGAEADAQPHPAALRDAVPRRPQAPAPPRRSSPSRSESIPSGSSRAATG